MKTNFCVVCGATSELEHHHIDPYGDDAPENLITVCSRHHGTVHNMKRRANIGSLTKRGLDKYRTDELTFVGGLIIMNFQETSEFTFDVQKLSKFFDRWVVKEGNTELKNDKPSSSRFKKIVNRMEEIFLDDPMYFKWICLDRNVGVDYEYKPNA